ncbi:hypothetical protein MACK_003279 [Theileria orientalis]|uniref:Uncharacterized protein n=1 Tax=Theileria orientalis TaxID=68886 RepID=A0A976SIE4_THEOR|nr:hypothetical protein MACK_003279 [Theileria orientalis]
MAFISAQNIKHKFIMENTYTFHSSFTLELIIQNTILYELNKGKNLDCLEVSNGITLQIPNIISKFHQPKNSWRIKRRYLKKLKYTQMLKSHQNDLKKLGTDASTPQNFI